MYVLSFLFSRNILKFLDKIKILILTSLPPHHGKGFLAFKCFYPNDRATFPYGNNLKISFSIF